MNFKATSLVAAFSLCTIAGTAFANVLHERETMAPFYKDASQKTLKPIEEFKVIFFGMPDKKQVQVKKACARQIQQPYTAFCANVNTLGGHE
jgi:hypothetical protein